MGYLNLGFLVTVFVGILLIVIGHRYRVPEHRSFFDGSVFRSSGLAPLSVVGIWKYKTYWQAPGFAIHAAGVIFLSIGILIGLVRVLLNWT